MDEKLYTYNDLLEVMESRGANLAHVSLGRMMDMVEEDTGKWPRWSDIAQPWVVDVCLNPSKEGKK